MYIVCLFVIYSLICLADAWWRCCMPYGVGKTSHIVAAYRRAADSHNWFLICLPSCSYTIYMRFSDDGPKRKLT